MFSFYRLNVRPSLAVDNISTVNTNSDLIFVFDDILPQAALQVLNSFKFESLNWLDRNGYSKHIFRPELPRPGFLNLTKFYILDHLKKISPGVSLDSICVELALKSTVGGKGQGVHSDCLELGPIWSMLIHVSGNDGNTVFVENSLSDKVVKEVEFKPGRVILFPSIYAHYGQLPSTGVRYIINNIVNLKNFEPTSRILDKSPDLLQFKDKMI